MPDRIYGRNFGRVPDELLKDTSVTDAACRLYAVLTRYAQQRERVTPGRKELASVLGWSLDKLDRATHELEHVGALFVQRRQHGEDGPPMESAYWLDGLRPDDDPSRKSAAKGSRTDAANLTSGNDKTAGKGSRKSAATYKREEREASPNGDGRPRPDGRSQTLVGRCIEAMGGRPVEAGAFAKIVNDAAKAGVSEEAIVRESVAWWTAERDGRGEPVAWLLTRLGQVQRAANGGERVQDRYNARHQPGDPLVRHAAAPAHDGRHDPACGCYVPPRGGAAPPVSAAEGGIRALLGLIPQPTPDGVAEQLDGEAPPADQNGGPT